MICLLAGIIRTSEDLELTFFFPCHCPWQIIFYDLIWFSRFVTYNSILHTYTNTVIVRNLRNETFYEYCKYLVKSMKTMYC